jgi:nitroreductase
VSEAGHPTVAYLHEWREPAEQLERAREFQRLMAARRTVRDISPAPVAREVVDAIVATAATAPSGANQQPWRFAIVSNPEIKRQIREAAEAEERENYDRRFPDAWKAHLAPLGTDWHKPFLEAAPYLIVVFRVDYTERERGDGEPGGRSERGKHYYVMESVGIAVGLLIAAIQNAGLVTVPHTPNPMGFLTRILERPGNERPYLLLPIGHPADRARVPNISRKPFDEVAVVFE